MPQHKKILPLHLLEIKTKKKLKLSPNCPSVLFLCLAKTPTKPPSLFFVFVFALAPLIGIIFVVATAVSHGKKKYCRTHFASPPHLSIPSNLISIQFWIHWFFSFGFLFPPLQQQQTKEQFANKREAIKGKNKNYLTNKEKVKQDHKEQKKDPTKRKGLDLIEYFSSPVPPPQRHLLQWLGSSSLDPYSHSSPHLICNRVKKGSWLAQPAAL